MGSIYVADFSARNNADWRDPFELKDGVGAWNLTGAVMTMTLKRRGGAAPADTVVLTLGDGLAITDAVQGLFEVRVLAADMADMVAGLWDHDLLIVQSGVTTSLWKGTAKIEEGVS